VSVFSRAVLLLLLPKNGGVRKLTPPYGKSKREKTGNQNGKSKREIKTGNQNGKSKREIKKGF